MTDLITERLHLRPFSFADAQALRQLINDRDIAAMTLNILHPYPDDAAELYIATSREAMERGERFSFAVVRHEDDRFIGSVSITLAHGHDRAELGYWIGKPYWGSGYASEAARRVVQFGFEVLNLHRIYATCFPENGASARVMQHAGMQFEGTLRQHVRKWEGYKDLHYYGIRRDEYANR